MFEVQGHEYRAGPAINQEIGSERCDASFPRCPSTMLFSFWKVTLPKAIIGLLLNTQKQKGRKSMSSNRHTDYQTSQSSCWHKLLIRIQGKKTNHSYLYCRQTIADQNSSSCKPCTQPNTLKMGPKLLFLNILHRKNN